MTFRLWICFLYCTFPYLLSTIEILNLPLLSGDSEHCAPFESHLGARRPHRSLGRVGQLSPKHGKEIACPFRVMFSFINILYFCVSARLIVFMPSLHYYFHNRRPSSNDQVRLAAFIYDMKLSILDNNDIKNEPSWRRILRSVVR